ncbi:MAG: hypothetical protein Q9214_004537, partial [Letrouitia sp. 1 TL-2023]
NPPCIRKRSQKGSFEAVDAVDVAGGQQPDDHESKSSGNDPYAEIYGGEFHGEKRRLMKMTAKNMLNVCKVGLVYYDGQFAREIRDKPTKTKSGVASRDDSLEMDEMDVWVEDRSDR